MKSFYVSCLPTRRCIPEDIILRRRKIVSLKEGEERKRVEKEREREKERS
jgi:hypothetical protein